MARWNRTPGILVGVLATALVAIPQTRAQNAFPLTQAVPDDAFLVVAERQTPEREFLRNHWNGVFEAFQESGFLEEMMDLVTSQMNDQERGEMDRLWSHFSELVSGVAWAQLGAQEFVFGERLSGPLMINGDFAGLMPDIICLFRSPGEASANAHAAMVGVLTEILKEVEQQAGLPLEMQGHTVEGWQVVTLNMLQMLPDAEPLTLSLGQKDDIQFFCFGRNVHEEVLALLLGKGDGRSIADTPDYQAALKALPTPEDGLEFVDIQVLTGNLRELADLLFAMVEQDVVRDQVRNARRNAEAMAIHERAYAIYEEGRLEEALQLTMEAHALDPSDSLLRYNLACLHALTGKPDAAMQWLQSAVEAGFHAPAKIQEDADLATLRERPAFADLVAHAKALAGSEEYVWLQFARSLANQGFGVLDMFDYSATVHTTDGFATHSRSVTMLTEDAAQNRFHAVLMSGRPMNDFSRYLPRETTSFRVSGSADPQAIYAWLEESIAQAGPPGQQLLGMWAGIQEQIGFHLQKDLLDWMGGTEVTASFPLEKEEAWVWMGEVKNEQVALGQLERALQLVPKAIQKLATEAPPLALLTMRTRPETAEDLAGFHRVFVGMMAKPALCGVRDGWLIVGSSADAVRRVLATAAGEYPNVLVDSEALPRILQPEGPAASVALTDHRKDAEMLAAMLGATSMVGGMVTMAIPEEEERAVVQRLFSAMGRLAPVVATMNFHETSASTTEFDGRRWITRSVNHYTPPTTH